ncbi:thiamine diphosphokinase [Arenibacterium halophilum]|uniref:Thiamine diphosphokinase n=1 Tax=Arenibacterium halophilum TaxID=2583821 RepID=A0ABY2XAT5_9RHOB|nr:thiamine diphosphokinase [Arenibacterium halophilum]TMV12847.1 thiamine diphosphokinase [Arenibacterium halophilum]
MNKILNDFPAITVVGGGAIGATDLSEALVLAPSIVAADGGAAVVLAAGRLPDMVIGDFDSLDATDRARIPPDRMHHVGEQDSTDFEKVLTRLQADLIVGIGFLGKRLDHQLAALNALARLHHLPCVLLGAHEVAFHLPSRITLNLERNDVVSLFPLAPVTGRSAGLEWPIDGLAFAPGARIGTSNRATGPVEICMDAPGMIALVPRARLANVAETLRSRAGAADRR